MNPCCKKCDWLAGPTHYCNDSSCECHTTGTKQSLLKIVDDKKIIQKAAEEGAQMQQEMLAQASDLFPKFGFHHGKKYTIEPIGWEEEFDRVFIKENIWKSDDEFTANVPVENIKDFIRQTLSQEREKAVLKGERLRIIEQIRVEEREKVVKMLEGMKKVFPSDGFDDSDYDPYNKALAEAISRIQEGK